MIKVPVKYSPTEEKMLKFLKAHASKQPVSSDKIVDRWYRGAMFRPHYDRQIVNGIIRGLIEKMEKNGERSKIVKGARSGPHPITYRVITR